MAQTYNNNGAYLLMCSSFVSARFFTSLPNHSFHLQRLANLKGGFTKTLAVTQIMWEDALQRTSTKNERTKCDLIFLNNSPFNE